MNVCTLRHAMNFKISTFGHLYFKCKNLRRPLFSTDSKLQKKFVINFMRSYFLTLSLLQNKFHGAHLVILIPYPKVIFVLETNCLLKIIPDLANRIWKREICQKSTTYPKRLHLQSVS